MLRIIISMAGLLITSSVFADGFFIGANVGGNLTMSSPVGDLPMAREEFEFQGFTTDDLMTAGQIMMNITNNGGTGKEALEAVKHLLALKLKYSAGVNININAGYAYKFLNVGVNWFYIRMSYDSINISADDDTVHPAWSFKNGSGKTVLNAFMLFGEYKITQLAIHNFTPVVGGSAGFANAQEALTIDSVTAKRDQNVFAYQIKLGANYKFTDNWYGNVETAFFGTSKIKATNTSLKQWQFINIGVRYLFN